MQSVFFALLNRLRSTARWSGMVLTQSENVAEHTFGVALFAHALAIIDRDVYGQNVDLGEVVAAALLHDASEAILTDAIAPVKKYNPEVEAAFKTLENLAEQQLLKTLPRELTQTYEALFTSRSPEVHRYVHAADKLDALCKCKLELRRGNQEFAIAAQQIGEAVEEFAQGMPSVRYFLDTFMPAFDHSIDEYRYLQ